MINNTIQTGQSWLLLTIFNAIGVGVLTMTYHFNYKTLFWILLVFFIVDLCSHSYSLYSMEKVINKPVFNEDMVEKLK